VFGRLFGLSTDGFLNCFLHSQKRRRENWVLYERLRLLFHREFPSGTCSEGVASIPAPGPASVGSWSNRKKVISLFMMRRFVILALPGATSMTWLNGIEIGATVLTMRSDQGQLSRFFTGFYLRKRSTKGQRNGGSIPLTRFFLHFS